MINVLSSDNIQLIVAGDGIGRGAQSLKDAEENEAEEEVDGGGSSSSTC